jgi:hypothetical protein
VVEALRPYAARDGAYVNGSVEFDGADTVQSAYGADKFTRLGRLKATYDPGNVFHGSAVIAPSSD